LAERFEFDYPDVEFLSFHEHNGETRLKEIGSRLQAESVVYVSDAGMPVISDPGQLLVAYCQAQDIKYDVLAGASAVTTAYAASGFEAGSFTFFGFLPSQGAKRHTALIEVMNSTYNMVLYEAPHRIQKLIEEILLIDENRELFLAKELTKKFQHYYRGDAKGILAQFERINTKGEWVVIIQAKEEQPKSLYLDELLVLDIAPKLKAKLLAKVTDKSTKEWYNELIAK
jgi:16S rRNA (cytidine1402-2'-O)-methyltransferase